MKKYFLSMSLILMFLLGCVSTPAQTSNKGTITIAVAESSPLVENEANPNSLYAGAKLAAEQINQLGGVNGFNLEVIAYADNNDTGLAAQIAQRISQSDAVAVIGHGSADTMQTAAPIYLQAGLPAINALPIDKLSFDSSSNYFNISYTPEEQGAYLANYAIRELAQTNAIIVYVDETSSAALARKFGNVFHGLGGTVSAPISLPLNASQGDIQLAVGKVFSANTGVLLLVGDETTSAEMVIALKNRGFQNPILGGDNLSEASFIKRIQAEGVEQARLGYFTDGIISTKAVLPDSAHAYTAQFIKDYQNTYHINTVSDSAAGGYDAVLTIAKAAQSIQTFTSSAEMRSKIMIGLAELNDADSALNGVTGAISFDRNGNVLRGPMFGIYQYGYLISAPYQYEPIPSANAVTNLDEQISHGEIITVDGRYVHRTHIIYAGMDIIEIRGLDQKESTYTADFYLWLRYIPDEGNQYFQPEQIVFINAEEPPSMDEINSETNSDGSVYKTFRVSGRFKNQFNFKAYPFDQQDLMIQFRNQTATTDTLEYVIDRPGMKYTDDASLLTQLTNNNVFASLIGWQPILVRVDQDQYVTTSTLGDPSNFDRTTSTNFSLFDIHLRIQRDSLEFIIKSLLPLLITLILAYITFYLPLGHSERLTVGSTALLTTAFFHLSLASSLPEIGYTIIIEYFFYAAYLMSALIVLFETLSIRLEKKSEDEKSKKKKEAYEATRHRLDMTGRIVYPSILGIVLLAGLFAYVGWIDFNASSETVKRAVADLQSPVSIASKPDRDAGEAESGVVTLELASWRPEDNERITALLEAFNKENPDIKVVHLPIFGPSYQTILNSRLSTNSGPDLFFVPPFQRVYSEYTLDLSSLPIESQYEQQLRTPWQDESGKFYGLPYVGVVQGIYYNKDIFDKLYLKPPTSWEELLYTAEAIRLAGYIPIANSFVKTEENDIFMNLAANFLGGPDGKAQYTDPADGGRCFNDPKSVRTFEAMKEILPYLSEDYNLISSYTSKQRFIDQQAAMLFGGSWDVGLFTSEAKFNWSVMPVPASWYDKTYVIFQPDVAIGLNKNISSAKQQAGLKFLAWLTTEKSLNITQELLPGFYPLTNLHLNDVSNVHSLEFQELTRKYPTDLRWAYSELSLTNQLPAPASLMQSAQYAMVEEGITPQQAADRLQEGLSQWYEPAQTCAN